jgi:sugar phosphate isomerase/epimerase
VNLAVFTKPWPQDSVADLAQRVAALGFDSAELPVRPGYQVDVGAAEKELPNLVSVFADHGLTVASVATVLDERAFAGCANAGIGLIRVMAPITRAEYLRSEEEVRTRLVNALPLCERYGVKIGVQQHYGDNVCDATGLRLLLEGVDHRWVGAIWDAAHDALAGLEPENGLDAVGLGPVERRGDVELGRSRRSVGVSLRGEPINRLRLWQIGTVVVEVSR